MEYVVLNQGREQKLNVSNLKILYKHDLILH